MKVYGGKSLQNGAEMGFLDKVKSATGLGLSPAESYHRAYEKGVLLGNYAAASEMFGKAAEKFQEAAQIERVHRARAERASVPDGSYQERDNRYPAFFVEACRRVIDLGRILHVQSFVRTFVVEDIHEVIKPACC